MNKENNSSNVIDATQQEIISSIRDLQARKRSLIARASTLDDAELQYNLEAIGRQIAVLRLDYDIIGGKNSRRKITRIAVDEVMDFTVRDANIRGKLGYSSIEKQPVAEPPLLAESITRLFTSSTSIDALLGDRQEKFNSDVRQRGESKAKLFYWLETIRSCGPAALRLAHLAVKGVAVKYWLGS